MTYSIHFRLLAEQHQQQAKAHRINAVVARADPFNESEADRIRREALYLEFAQASEAMARRCEATADDHEI